eukprot:jgi/Mesvir1/5384/Mv15460-RA.1
MSKASRAMVLSIWFCCMHFLVKADNAVVGEVSCTGIDDQASDMTRKMRNYVYQPKAGDAVGDGVITELKDFITAVKCQTKAAMLENLLEEITKLESKTDSKGEILRRLHRAYMVVRLEKKKVNASIPEAPAPAPDTGSPQDDDDGDLYRSLKEEHAGPPSDVSDVDVDINGMDEESMWQAVDRIDSDASVGTAAGAPAISGAVNSATAAAAVGAPAVAGGSKQAPRAVLAGRAAPAPRPPGLLSRLVKWAKGEKISEGMPRLAAGSQVASNGDAAGQGGVADASTSGVLDELAVDQVSGAQTAQGGLVSDASENAAPLLEDAAGNYGGDVEGGEEGSEDAHGADDAHDIAVRSFFQSGGDGGSGNVGGDWQGARGDDSTTGLVGQPALSLSMLGPDTVELPPATSAPAGSSALLGVETLQMDAGGGVVGQPALSLSTLGPDTVELPPATGAPAGSSALLGVETVQMDAGAATEGSTMRRMHLGPGVVSGFVTTGVLQPQAATWHQEDAPHAGPPVVPAPWQLSEEYKIAHRAQLKRAVADAIEDARHPSAWQLGGALKLDTRRAPVGDAENAPLGGPLDAAVNTPLGTPLDAPLDSPLDSPLDAPLPEVTPATTLAQSLAQFGDPAPAGGGACGDSGTCTMDCSCRV